MSECTCAPVEEQDWANCPTNNSPLTVEILDSMPVGTRIDDATKDLWQKQDNGMWTHRDGLMTSEALVHVWGPIRPVQDPLF